MARNILRDLMLIFTTASQSSFDKGMEVALMDTKRKEKSYNKYDI